MERPLLPLLVGCVATAKATQRLVQGQLDHFKRMALRDDFFEFDLKLPGDLPKMRASACLDAAPKAPSDGTASAIERTALQDHCNKAAQSLSKERDEHSRTKASLAEEVRRHAATRNALSKALKDLAAQCNRTRESATEEGKRQARQVALIAELRETIAGLFVLNQRTTEQFREAHTAGIKMAVALAEARLRLYELRGTRALVLARIDAGETELARLKLELASTKADYEALEAAFRRSADEHAAALSHKEAEMAELRKLLSDSLHNDSELSTKRSMLTTVARELKQSRNLISDALCAHHEICTLICTTRNAVQRVRDERVRNLGQKM